MSAANERRPVSRPRALLGLLILVAVLGATITLAETLRHPPVIAPAPQPEPDAGDPRVAIECPSSPSSETGLPSVTSDDLYECPAVYDGVQVRYEGEVVGAVMRRREGAWTQLNDDAYAGDLGPLPAHRDFRGGNAGVGVHLPIEIADRIDWVGGPSARGDVLAVIGTFHRVDATSGEVTVIRAESAETVRAGEPIEQPPLTDRRLVGTLIAVAAMLLYLGERVVRHRRR